MALLLWAWICLPLALGQETLFYRDVFTTHLHLKSFGAQELAQGRIPAVNPGWGLGQPFRGNPNALPFYPGNLLYLFLPFWSAFNLHYMVHWLLALFSMQALARALGQSRSAALFAGLVYAGSGWVVTALSFYNLLTVSAWWPLAILGAVRGGRRGVALGGLACGLALLGGEPFLAALGLAPLLALAVVQWGWRRGIREAFGVGAVGLCIALPQAVATLRVLSFTSRGAVGVAPGEASIYALPLIRLVELLAPTALGRPGELGELSYGAVGWLQGPPYVLTIFVGIVPLWLALVARRRGLLLLSCALAGVLLAWLGGALGPLWQGLSGGLARYPSKLLFWTALTLPLAAGFSLDGGIGKRHRGAMALGLALVGVGAVLPILLSHQGLSHLLPESSSLAEPGVAFVLLGLPLVLGGATLALSAWALEKGGRAWVPLLHVLAMLQMAPLVLTAPTRPFQVAPPLAAQVPTGSLVLSAVSRSSLEAASPPLELPESKAVELVRATTAQLDFPTGIPLGYGYPLAPDLDGIHSPFLLLLQRNLPVLSWAERVRWFQVLGLDAVVLPRDPGQAGLRTVAADRIYGVTTILLEVEDPLPPLLWPKELEVAESPLEALFLVSRLENPGAVAVVPQELPHDPEGRVRLLEESPDLLVLESEGGGGVALLQRSYLPLYRVRGRHGAHGPMGPHGAKLIAADLCLLGAVLPPGEQRVEIYVNFWPVLVAGLLALLATVVALLVWWRS